MATAAVVHAQQPTDSRSLNTGLWVAQALLGAAFLMSGLMKVATPMETLLQRMPWVSGALGPAVRFIGTVEILGALGLILPSLTRVKTWLTPLAAVGLATVMGLAALTHLVRGEPQILPVNLVLGGIAAFIAWGRGRRLPIAGR